MDFIFLYRYFSCSAVNNDKMSNDHHQDDGEMIGSDTVMTLRVENARLRRELNEKGLGGEQATTGVTTGQESAGSGAQSNGNGGGDQDLQMLEMSLKISQLESELDEARREKGDSECMMCFFVNKLSRFMK
jgi:hypothetical protein